MRTVRFKAASPIRRFVPKEYDPGGQITHNWGAPPIVSPILHPDTLPEAIALEQRRVVRAAMRLVGRDPARLSDATDLPVWTVERRLAEILRRAAGGTARVHPCNVKTAERIARHLRANGPSTVKELTDALGMHHQRVSHSLRSHAELFKSVGCRANAQSLLRMVWDVRKDAGT